MVNQVSPMGSLATGPPVALLAASAPRPAPEPTRTAKVASSPPQGTGSQPPPVTAHTSELAMEQVNSHLQQAGSELKFRVDQDTGRTVFKVINPNTGEVLLQVPSEELLALARNLRRFQEQMGASGVLVDKEG